MYSEIYVPYYCYFFQIVVVFCAVLAVASCEAISPTTLVQPRSFVSTYRYDGKFLPSVYRFSYSYPSIYSHPFYNPGLFSSPIYQNVFTQPSLISQYPVQNNPVFTNPIFGQNPVFGYPGFPAQTPVQIPVQTPVQAPAHTPLNDPNAPGVSIGDDSVSVEAAN